MKTLLCYGDSNTWGHNADNGERLDNRYPRILQQLLGAQWNVVEEGCPGRTTVYDIPTDPYLNGRTYLYPCLHSHRPIDIVILMLGTNDLQILAGANAFFAALGVERLINDIRRWSQDMQLPCPQILLISPPLIGEHSSTFSEPYINYPWAMEQSRQFRKLYEEVACRQKCLFLAAEDYTKPGQKDGIHITADSHFHLATAIFETIKTLHE